MTPCHVVWNGVALAINGNGGRLVQNRNLVGRAIAVFGHGKRRRKCVGVEVEEEEKENVHGEIRVVYIPTELVPL